MAVASMTFLASCGDGDTEEPLPDAPVVSVTSGSEVVPGGVFTAAVEVTAAGGFDRLNVYIDGTFNAEYNASAIDGVEDGAVTTFTVEVATTLANSVLDDTFEFTYEVVDKNNLQGEANYTVDISSPEARVYTTFLLAAPLANDPDTPTDDRNSMTFYSTNLGERISAAAIVASEASSADVDFGYYATTNANGFCLAAPASYPSAVYDLSATGQQWGTLNATIIKETSLNAAAFAETTTWAGIDAAFEAGTNEAGLQTNLEADMVLAFETDADKEGGSKRGLILVVETVDANGDGNYYDENDGIKIQVIVQEDAD